MSNLPISSKYRSTPTRPVDDAERNALVARLNTAFTDGRIDSDAYARLLDVAFGAKTLGELVPVVEALPSVPTYAVPDAVLQTGTPGQLAPARLPNSRAVAIGVVALVGALAVVAMLLALLLT